MLEENLWTCGDVGIGLGTELSACEEDLIESLNYRLGLANPLLSEANIT